MGPAGGPNDKRRLAVAMLLWDQDDDLHGLIQSLAAVRRIVDEIVLGNANAALGREAKRLGARVIPVRWQDGAAAARNRLLDQLQVDWLLWLEADERIASESAAALRDFVDRQADPDTVYRLWVEIPPGSRRASSQRCLQARLVPCRADLRYVGHVGETLDPAASARGLRFGTAPGVILSSLQQQKPDRKAARARRQLELANLRTAPPAELAARVKVAQADALADLGQLQAARQTYLAALNAAASASPEMLEAYYGLLADFHLHRENVDWAEWVCLDALETFPRDAQLLTTLGHIYQLSNRLDRAASAFRAAAFQGTIEPRVWHLKEIRPMAAVALSVVLQLAGRTDQARVELERAAEMFPGSARVLERLLEIYVQLRDEEKAVELVQAMPIEPRLREPARRAIRGACASLRSEWSRAVGLLQSAYVAGFQEVFCLRWLAVTLLANGQLQAARPVVAQWLHADPEDGEALRYWQVIESQSPPPSPSASQPDRRLRIDPATAPLPPAAPHPAVQRPAAPRES